MRERPECVYDGHTVQCMVDNMYLKEQRLKTMCSVCIISSFKSSVNESVILVASEVIREAKEVLTGLGF